MSQCQHQSLHRISVEGKRPDGTEWYECNNKKCGVKICIRTVVEIPRSIEQRDAEKHGVIISTRAIAKDGSSWDSVKLALKRNELLKEVDEVMSFLQPRTPELENGDGYIQQNEGSVDEFKLRFTKLVTETYGREPLPSLDHAISNFAEEGHPFHTLNERLKCIDVQNREWQNPFLAEHPEDGKQVELNTPSNGGTS